MAAIVIPPVPRSATKDMRSEFLPPCWIRRRPTLPDQHEDAAQGLYRTGPNGAFRKALIDAIDGAREVVLLSSFLLADEDLGQALIRAADCGKRVYVLTASEQRLAKLPDDEAEFEARMIEQHKRLLDSFAGKILLRSAEHLHAKFLVTDPKGTTRGWISTANLNRALVESVEIGVEVDQDAARALAGWFSYAFWVEAEREIVERGRLSEVGKPPALPAEPAHRRLVVTTHRHTSLRDAVIDTIHGARTELVMSSYGLERSHPALEALLNARARGVAVTVLTRPRPAAVPAVAALAEAGARIFAHDKLHAKAIANEASGLVMTANLEARGLDHGFEVGVRLEGRLASALTATLREWVECFPWEYASAASRGSVLGEICLADHGPRRRSDGSDGLRDVVEEHAVRLPPVVAPSALSLDQAVDPELKVPDADKRLPRRVRFEWEVRPPQLPRTAREIKRRVQREGRGPDGKPRVADVEEPYDPPLYEHAGETFVLVRSSRDIEPARQLSAEFKAKVVVP